MIKISKKTGFHQKAQALGYKKTLARGKYPAEDFFI